MLSAVGLCALAVGCAVPQKPGLGKAMIRSEATTHRPYGLYLPKGYRESNGQRADGRRYPMVVTFHGMRPFDDYGAHLKQWQQEADRYGLIVIAPRLLSCDVAQPFPINSVTNAVKADERATLAILDEVCRLTNADPNHVLSTSFSSGGYLAHYMVNRHPSRFSCIAVFQSNFSAEILDPKQVRKYQDHVIAVLTSENDLGVSREGSLEAVAWYRRRGFRKVVAKTIAAMGHERTPEIAAAVFADDADLQANAPPNLAGFRLSNRQQAWPPPGAARGESRGQDELTMRSTGRRVRSPGGDLGQVIFAPNETGPNGVGRIAAADPPSGAAVSDTGGNGDRSGRPAIKIRTVPRAKRSAQVPAVPLKARRAPPPARKTPPRGGAKAKPTAAFKPVARIRINSTIGLAPHLVSFMADIPQEYRLGADYLWMDNSVPICQGVKGQKILTTAGEHTLSVLIITRDNQELRASTKVTVLPPLSPRR